MLHGGAYYIEPPVGSVGKTFLGVMMIEERQTDLLEIALAHGTPSAFTRRLNRGQEQTDERADDRDHYEQFNEGESSCNPSESAGMWAQDC
jgi:hypothetical protein